MDILKKPKKEFLLRNGEMLKRKQIAYWGERAFPIRIFSAEELRKSITPMRGSNMWKGCIDGRSFIVDSAKIAFREHMVIDEIAIQANISHRNVLRIPGCCLETLCPIPIYEFISGARTLSVHLHFCQLNAEQLRWSDRMRIAAEVADALNYLHTDSSMPIIHRGVGPLNILLDDRLTAKLTGFRWSLPMSTVRRKGFDSFETSGVPLGSDNEKDDVYDFGIVMLLLLTGKGSLYSLCQGRPVAFIVEILASFREMGCYLEIPFQGKKGKIQAFLPCEGKMEQVEASIEVTWKCIDKEKESRPIMKEVVQSAQTNKKYIATKITHQL